MVHFIAAVVTAVVLSLSPSTVKNGDSFKATATVTGPFEGQVCVLIGNDEAQEVVAESCNPEVVTVKDGEKQDVVFDFHAPESATKGSYSLMAVLSDEDETVSTIVKLVIE